jgi:histidine triad (HIT) family protein
VVAFRDIDPKAPFHVLIVPREPLPNTSAFTPETEHIAGRMLRVAGEIARQEGVIGGYRLVINEGENGGQEVPHVHMHMLAGRKMTWPPG